jgi:hypothetical protein
VKRFIILVILITCGFHLLAQDSTKRRKSSREERREEKRQRTNALVKQEEEGALVYNKQNVFGVELRTNGYGFFYDFGKLKARRRASLFGVEFSEIKDSKEEKTPTGFFSIGNPYIYGKINNFYQLKFGYGQQHLLGQKGNKNGVAIIGTYQGGLALGFLRPYYVIIDEGNETRPIKYSERDSSKFLDQSIIRGGGGLGKGWDELKVKPGIYLKGALRFDWGRYNEMVYGVEIGFSVETYSNRTPLLLYTKDRYAFYQGHLALIFGRRK